MRADCEACTSTLQGLLANKKLEVTAPFCRIVADCLSQVCVCVCVVYGVVIRHKHFIACSNQACKVHWVSFVLCRV